MLHVCVEDLLFKALKFVCLQAISIFAMPVFDSSGFDFDSNGVSLFSFTTDNISALLFPTQFQLALFDQRLGDGGATLKKLAHFLTLRSHKARTKSLPIRSRKNIYPDTN